MARIKYHRGLMVGDRIRKGGVRGTIVGFYYNNGNYCQVITNPTDVGCRAHLMYQDWWIDDIERKPW